MRQISLTNFVRTRLTLMILVTIVAIGAILRLTGINWDSGQHLHPDERYISMVANDISWPSSLGEYFDVQRSPLSPYNYPQYKNYLYGTLPLFTVKAAAESLEWGSYGQLNLAGRLISALLDTFSILLVFLIAQKVLGEGKLNPSGLIALFAAAFYAITVTAIQHAHFFTMESWLVFFTLLTFYLTTFLVINETGVPRARGCKGKFGLAVLVGVSFGLTLASKLNGAFVIAPVGVAFLAGIVKDIRAVGIFRALVKWSTLGLVLVIAGYLTFRLTSPYAFAHNSWLDLTPNPDLVAALRAQSAGVNGEFLYPPAYQWLLSTPIISPLKNLIVWGMGVPLGISAVLGVLWLTAGAIKWRSCPPPKLMLIGYVLVVFLYVGSRFVHSIRYLLPIVPFLCMAAAYMFYRLRRSRVFSAAMIYIIAAMTLGLTSLYALAFTGIYFRPNTRVAASGWIYQNISPDKFILLEHWDDPLPLRLPDKLYAYSSEMMPVFDPDDEEKLSKLYHGLSKADYYVLSSPRAWESIGRLPQRFPVMSRFYQLLFEEKLGFVKAAEFTSYPALGKITLPDLSAEETFWVYDHAPVIIFRKSEQLGWEEFQSLFADV